MNTPSRCMRALALICCGAAACGPSASPRTVQSKVPRDANPGIEAGAIRELADANNAFAFDLYESVRARPGNLVFSPYSISAALAMTDAGARGDTASQMAKALHFELPQDSLHAGFNQLDLAMSRSEQPPAKGEQPLQLKVANSVWVEQTLPLLPAYLDLIGRNYGAGVHPADFLTKSDAARRQINHWVSDQTQAKIRDVIAERAVDAATRLVLVNAIYFKGDWQDQFNPNDTSDSPFVLSDGSRVQARFMSGHLSDALYGSGEGCQVVELAYQGGNAAMDFLLPDEGALGVFENQLDGGKLEAILARLQASSVALRLPKFEFNTSIDLGGSLSGLGMPDAFNPNLADFSGMTGNRDLFISKVLHQSFVAVGEKGTEAAAATSVIMAPTAALRAQVELTLDHPFVFVIRHLATGQILFVGRVLDPTR